MKERCTQSQCSIGAVKKNLEAHWKEIATAAGGIEQAVQELRLDWLDPETAYESTLQIGRTAGSVIAHAIGL